MAGSLRTRSDLNANEFRFDKLLAMRECPRMINFQMTILVTTHTAVPAGDAAWSSWADI